MASQHEPDGSSMPSATMLTMPLFPPPLGSPEADGGFFTHFAIIVIRQPVIFFTKRRRSILISGLLSPREMFALSHPILSPASKRSPSNSYAYMVSVFSKILNAP